MAGGSKTFFSVCHSFITNYLLTSIADTIFFLNLLTMHVVKLCECVNIMRAQAPEMWVTWEVQEYY